AARQPPDRPVLEPLEPDARDRLARDLPVARADAPSDADASQPSHQDDVEGGHGEARGEHGALGNVSGPRGRWPRRGDPVDAHAPRPRRDEADDRPDQRRLPSAVGADQAEDPPPVNGEADPLEHRRLAEHDVESLDLDHGPLVRPHLSALSITPTLYRINDS